MFGDLGESAKLAFAFAIQVSQESKQFYIGTEHLFLGVARLEDVSINHQFARAGVDVGAVERAIIKDIEAVPVGTQSDEVTVTPRTEHVVNLAMNEAHRRGGGLVEAPDILIGILEDGRGVAARAVKRCGGDLGEIAGFLRDMMLKEEWTPNFYNTRKVVEQPGIEKTGNLMETLGRDLTRLAEEGGLDPIIGRESELLKVIQILLSRRKNNPMLIGDAGVGKTAVVEGLAQLIASGNAPPELKGKHIQTIEVGALVSGTIFRGSFENKLLGFVKEARENPDVIVFIDEIHMLVGAGTSGHNEALDAANILKPALSQGDFKCIGATTYSEYRKYIESDPALARRFQPVFVGEPAPEDTLEILEGLRGKYEDFHEVKILDEALEAAVELSRRYITDRRLPDKAIDLLDQACSQRKLRTYYGFGEVDRLTREEKLSLFSTEAQPRRPAILLISAEDIARVLAGWTGIPVGRLTQQESERLINMETLMCRRLIGQDEAVEAVAQAIRTSRAGMRDSRRPTGAFLFLGPTGVGKTECARTLAEILFDDEDKIIRVDMSECYDQHFISRLIGSPPGYVDSDRGGQLTEAVKKNPYSVVLFDEIEKAYPNVLDLLLQVMDEGRLTDALGRLVSFRNTIIIMTSNIGSADLVGGSDIGFHPPGWTQEEETLSSAEVHRQVERELKRSLRPEFINRLDEVVIFNPLGKEDLRKIALLLLSKIPVKVEANKKALDFLVDARYEPAMGARPLRRTIDDYVVEPLANKLIKKEISESDVVKLGLSGGKLTFRKKPGADNGQEAVQS